MADVLRVKMSYFFDKAMTTNAKAADPKLQSLVDAFQSDKDGLALAKAFMAIKDQAVRKRVVELVVQVARP